MSIWTVPASQFKGSRSYRPSLTYYKLLKVTLIKKITRYQSSTQVQTPLKWWSRPDVAICFMWRPHSIQFEFLNEMTEMKFHLSVTQSLEDPGLQPRPVCAPEVMYIHSALPHFLCSWQLQDGRFSFSSRLIAFEIIIITASLCIVPFQGIIICVMDCMPIICIVP